MEITSALIVKLGDFLFLSYSYLKLLFSNFQDCILHLITSLILLHLLWINPLLLLLLLLLLSRSSHVRLCATPQMAAHQAPPSLGFSRQEHWSGLPFPSPMHESEKWKWSRSVMFDSSDPMDCSLPCSSVHGIFQAKVLEWDAIAFSAFYMHSWLNHWPHD